MGVWIETFVMGSENPEQAVTPFVGVWIETKNEEEKNARLTVTPFVGVWIETTLSFPVRIRMASHTLRGCVD